MDYPNEYPLKYLLLTILVFIFDDYLRVGRAFNIIKTKSLKTSIENSNNYADIFKINDKNIRYEISSKLADFKDGILNLEDLDSKMENLNKLSKTDTYTYFENYLKPLKDLEHSYYNSKKLKYTPFNIDICIVSEKLTLANDLCDLYFAYPNKFDSEEMNISFLKGLTKELSFINSNIVEYVAMKYPNGFKDKYQVEKEHIENRKAKYSNKLYLAEKETKIKQEQELANKKFTEKLNRIHETIKIVTHS